MTLGDIKRGETITSRLTISAARLSALGSERPALTVLGLVTRGRGLVIAERRKGPTRVDGSSRGKAADVAQEMGRVAVVTS